MQKGHLRIVLYTRYPPGKNLSFPKEILWALPQNSRFLLSFESRVPGFASKLLGFASKLRFPSDFWVKSLAFGSTKLLSRKYPNG
jgi:hypothetical protein